MNTGNFKTISEERILELAWLKLLDVQGREYDLLHRLEDEEKNGNLTKARIARYRNQLNELEKALIQLRKRED